MARELRLKLLSYNIQIAAQHAHAGHYVTRAWRHALPGRDMHATLDRIADLARGYDFVAIQEGDAGLKRRGLCVADACPPTFPSWQPRRDIDHVLTSRGVRLHALHALPHPLSDHLPLAAEISLSLGA